MFNFANCVSENKTEHNKKQPYTPDHPYRILITGGSGSGSGSGILNLIEKQAGIDKIYLYAKDPCEVKYQYLINIREKVDLKRFNDPKAFMSIRMTCVMFTKILMNTTQIKNIKY